MFARVPRLKGAVVRRSGLNRRLRQRPSPPLVISLIALFVSLGGASYAATGGNFILGNPNTASSATELSASGASTATALKLTNTNTAAGATALSLNAAAGHPPLNVNTSAKVASLNVDLLDNLDSSAFLRQGIAQSAAVSSAGGVVDVTNTGTTNGVQGRTSRSIASGVYGENTGGGFGVAGRSNRPNGTGVFGEALGGGNAHGVSALANGSGGAIVASNTGNGPALELHSPGDAPMTVDSSVKVNLLNADKLDGRDSTEFLAANGQAADSAKLGGLLPNQFIMGDPGRGGRLMANRVVNGFAGQVILIIPGMGRLVVKSCDGTKADMTFDTVGTGAVDVTFSLVWFQSGPGVRTDTNAFISTSFDIPHQVFGPQAEGFITANVARDTATATKIATIWAGWSGFGCRFFGQALLSPQL
jgi:hypothetical protein